MNREEYGRFVTPGGNQERAIKNKSVSLPRKLGGLESMLTVLINLVSAAVFS